MNRFSMGFLALLLVSTPDLDAQTEDGFYVELDAGLSSVSDYTTSDFFATPSTVKFDGGANFGGALGYRFLHHYRAEVNISHRNADVDTVDDVAGSGDIEVTSFMANVYYDVDLETPLEPYLGTGVGTTRGDLNGTTGTTTIDFSDKATFNLMVGASYRIHEGIDLSFGYRYLTFSPDFFAEGVNIHEFLIGVRYQF